ncbi:thioredoxin family protein [Georgenia yuyongxinii]|uniref:Thioredoxin family protein n=1 Tax=Georgenia yuyongxinii TaxID=2589797 RepID=A0A5B8C1Q1_9MICO|nr:thioredoxin family protein [Georgenia yuyongxinii]QDC24599.1 thioredoxin family protein [Georgenia yuyongxinii]
MPDILLRAAVIAVVLAVASGLWLLRERRRGQLRPVRAGTAADSLTLARVRAAVGPLLDPGARATLVQLSSETCTPCRQSARTWSSLTPHHPGVNFLEIDAAEHLDLARAFDVLRTPTTLVFDAAGTAVGRVLGPPTPSQAREILAGLHPIPEYR